LTVPHLKLKLKTNLYSTIKSEDSETLDDGTMSSQREYGEIKAVSDAALVMSAGRLFQKVGAATLKARLP